MFDNAIRENNPRVVIRKELINGTRDVDERVAHGHFRRVFPVKMTEVRAVLMGELHEERFAPVKGEGVLISEALWKMVKGVAQ